MKRLFQTLTLAALFAAVLTLPALAGDHQARAFAGRRPGGSELRCLRAADLTEQQKTDIKAIFDAARPGFEADVASIRAARQKLHADADADAGADKSVLGQDFLDVRAAAKKLRDDHSAARDQILSKLTADQKTKVQSCLDSSGRRMGARMGSEF